jgi:hypothetical protein
MLTILSNKRVVAIIGLIGSFLFLTQPQGVQAAGLVKAPNNLGLVGYWSFEDGKLAKATDFSGKGNTGTLTNMEEADWVQGKAGKALIFDGVNEYIALPAFQFGNGKFTISTWVKPSNIAQTSLIFGKYTNDANNSIQFLMVNGDLYGRAHNGSSGWIGRMAPGVLASSEWQHISLTYDGGTTASAIAIYKNGVQVDTTNDNSGSFTGWNDPNVISQIASQSSGASTFNGSIDDVRIYNRTLSAAEVASLYAQSSQAVIKNASRGLVAHWTFEEGAGTTTADKTGNGNTGALTNGPTWSAGKYGKAVSFDGTNDYVGTTLTIGKTFTWSAWFKAASFGSFQNIMDVGNPNYMLVLTSSNSLGFWSADGMSGGALGTSALSADTWYHVTFVREGDSITNGYKAYFNGAYTGAANTGTWSSTDYFVIGGRTDGQGQYFPGVIDDVRVYNRALSAQEVLNLYNSSGEALGILNRVHRDVLTSGLAGYWSFDGSQMSGNTALDSSGSGLSATLTSGPSKTIGVLGQGIRLDGVDDYVTVGDALALNGAQPRTLSTWLKFSADPLTSAQWIIERGNATNATYWLWWNGDNSYSLGDNTLICGQRISNGSGEQVANTWTPSPNIWYHVACTYTGTQLIEYINGVQLGSAGSATGSVADETSTARSLQFGRRTSTGGNLLVGYLDDVRIYSRALTASEILSLFNLAGGSSLNP